MSSKIIEPIKIRRTCLKKLKILAFVYYGVYIEIKQGVFLIKDGILQTSKIFYR